MEPDNPADPFKALEPIKDVPIAPAHGIAAIALSLALKYHDINTVQDGLLYQQYKLEGKNFHDLHIDHVFATAEKMELWLMASNERIASVIVDALADGAPEVVQAENTDEDKED